MALSTLQQFQQFQQQGASEKKKLELTDKLTKDILKTVHVLNKSGTKRATLGLDPELDFTPFVQLHKPGFDGVRISTATWQELMAASTYITSFFKGELDSELTPDTLLLGPMEKLTFRRQYGRNMLSITCVLDDKKEVVLAYTTWKRLLELAPCITYCLGNLSTWQSEAMEMFVAFAHAVKARLLPSTMNVNIPHPNANDDIIMRALSGIYPSYNDVKTVQSLDLINLNFTPKNAPLMDYQKCFYELQAFCFNEIICYVTSV